MKLLVGLCCIVSQAVFASEGIILRSPNGKIAAMVNNGDDGRLSYTISADGNTVLAPSPLGITVDGVDLGKDAKIIDKTPIRKIRESYPIYGNHAIAQNTAQELTISLDHAGKQFGLIVRAYNDGVAVRYVFPKDAAHIDGETTSWALPKNTEKIVWAELSQCYEGLSHATPLNAVPEGQPVMGPITAVVGNYFLCISEASCETFSDMNYIRNGNTLQAAFPFQPNGWNIKPDSAREPKVTLDGTYQGGQVSPWRYTIIAHDLTELVNSDMMTNLCQPPAKGMDYSWAKPGRCLWQWWSVGAPIFDEQKNWFDAAAKMKWEYYLIDDGWSSWRSPGKDCWAMLKECIDYGKSIGVESIVWVDSSEMRDSKSRRAYLQKVKALGASGIKIDFIPDATSEIMQWYIGGMQDCAELKLTLNYHGSVKPTGLNRTYPMALTREAVRGDEYHMTRYGRVMPHTQDVTLPFARCMAGAADITPVMMNPSELITNHYTWPHELAQAIVYLSPITHFADHYRYYVGSPVEDLLQELPTVWDETRVLDCTEIGEVVGYARRKGNTWWIGIMNGGSERTVTVPLKLINGSLHGTLIYDHPQKDDAVIRQEKTVSKKDTITIKLRQAGGFIARFGKPVFPLKGQ